MLYVIRCKMLLMVFGRVSGLRFLWDQTVAAFIPEGPPPAEFSPLPWKWELSTDASPLLGFPVAAEFSVMLMEDQIMGKVDDRLARMNGRHLALAARVTVANGLILSSLWYLITLWAGDFSFFGKIQRKLEAFIWAGQPRVDRDTISQGKGQGGLGLLSVMEQYRAMAGNLMIWVLGPGTHPLRLILQSHIQELSTRKWGIPNFTWIVTKGGSSDSLGSPSWKNICRAWGNLKPLLRKATPRNQEEWEDLPLWRPHVHHLNESRARCFTLAQKRLQAAGLTSIKDISEANGQFKRWEELPVRHGDLAGQRAFNALVANISPPIPAEPQPGPHIVFYGEESSETDGNIWKFDVQQNSVSSSWVRIRASSLPVSTFHCRAGFLRAIPRSCPPQSTSLRRVLIRHSKGKSEKRSHFGFWSEDRKFLMQYTWSDGTPILDTSTSQLRVLQAPQRFRSHKVADKWERELSCNIPVTIWQRIWMNFGGASENTFLWQLYFRAIATQRWRFPSAPPDPQIQCSRCDTREREDLIHCIWSCPLARPCWDWGFSVLCACSAVHHGVVGLQGRLEPAHVFIAYPLPAEWKIPERLWQILRAVICWQVWKARNEHVMANRPSDHRRTIRKVWHRFSMYLRGMGSFEKEDTEW